MIEEINKAADNISKPKNNIFFSMKLHEKNKL